MQVLQGKYFKKLTPDQVNSKKEQNIANLPKLTLKKTDMDSLKKKKFQILL